MLRNPYYWIVQKHVSTIHPQRAFFYTSVRDLLHPSNSFIDKTILNTRNLESKTDKASEFKKQQLTVCGIKLKAMLSWCFQNSFKRQKYSCHRCIINIWLPFVISHKIIVLYTIRSTSKLQFFKKSNLRF